MVTKISNRDLAIKMATAETEDEIVGLLKDLGYWDNYAYWRPYGDNYNNFSTIGNQQSEADAALVEKLINSVDAILMKECLRLGIDPTDKKKAPQTMAEAQERFLDMGKNEKMSSLPANDRAAMGKNIILAATRPDDRPKTYMNITIADRGEGQTPKQMPNTILSLGRDNKLRVPFVQGKFNMGGTGALPFCGGANRLQLVISKRCPLIPNSDNDETYKKWSVTVVRREKEREDRRSTMYTYLTDEHGQLLSFSADSLPIIPSVDSSKEDNPKKYEPMEYGAYFKLYDYSMNKKGYRSNIMFDLNYRLAMLIPDLGHPIRLLECRGYKAHTPYATLSGLNTRLIENRNDNIEEGFPASEIIYVDGQKISCDIYVFKKSEGREPRSKNYREKYGILYTVNGQTHAAAPETFFNKVNLSYIADSILVLVDCSKIDNAHREDMFMNSRDRLRKGEFSTKIEDQIKTMLHDHRGLRKLQNERRADAQKDRLEDDKPFRDMLQKILKQSPVLSKILLENKRDVPHPYKVEPTGVSEKPFVGKKHPTYFRNRGKAKNESITRKVPVNKSFRVQFETDVANDYFTRQNERGSLELYMDDIPHSELKRNFGLFNGIVTLGVSLPKDMKEGDTHRFRAEIVDDCIPNTLSADFICEGAPEVKESPSGSENSRKGTPPKGSDTSKNRSQPSYLGIPEPQEVYHEDWSVHEMNAESALVVRQREEGSDYYLNMDNKYLLTETKQIKDEGKLALVHAYYKYSMTIIGMSIESYYKNRNNKESKEDEENEENEEDIDVETKIREISSMISPVIVPLIDAMVKLKLDKSPDPESEG